MCPTYVIILLCLMADNFTCQWGEQIETWVVPFNGLTSLNTVYENLWHCSSTATGLPRFGQLILFLMYCRLIWYLIEQMKCNKSKITAIPERELFLCWCNVLRWIWCLWCYSECISTPGKICLAMVGIKPTTFGILACVDLFMLGKKVKTLLTLIWTQPIIIYRV
jgi:hypothetical protein